MCVYNVVNTCYCDNPIFLLCRLWETSSLKPSLCFFVRFAPIYTFHLQFLALKLNPDVAQVAHIRLFKFSFSPMRCGVTRSKWGNKIVTHSRKIDDTFLCCYCVIIWEIWRYKSQNHALICFDMFLKTLLQ